MFPQRWIVLYLLMSVPLVISSLDIIEQDSGVTCSQSLSDCVLTDGFGFDVNSVKVTDLSPQEKLCCRRDPCALCLLIHMELELDQADDEEEENSGRKDEDSTEETANSQDDNGSVTVCYKTPELLPTCEKVEFTVNQSRPSQQSTAQISMVITNAVISYGSKVYLTLPDVSEIIKEVNVPSLKDVCSSDIKTYVQECNVPSISPRINKANQVELYVPGSNSSIPNVCLLNETNGTCQMWDRKPIPLQHITPCTCFEAWKEDNQKTTVRSRSCPFKNYKELRVNVWKNVALSVVTDNVMRLWWNVSAPCRIQGEVWACERTPGPTGCIEKEGFRQQLGNDSWTQNRNGLWGKTGLFAQISLENHPCVMIKIKEMEHVMGPFCYNNIGRWRWSLFVVAVMLLLSLTLLITFCLRGFIKKSVRSWHHRDLVNTHKPHVLVLSPPDSDEEVSAAVCSLGFLLYSRDFSVTVDQWSRRSQINTGPLPWSHCQLLKMDSQCERVVLFLTPKAVERADTWSSQDRPVIGLQEESPYSDVFRAALFAIQASKNQGRASERFALVTFDPLWTDAQICHNRLPEILQGLPLFHFPSQTEALMRDLYSRRTQNQLDKGTRTRFVFKNKDINRKPMKESETIHLQQI